MTSDPPPESTGREWIAAILKNAGVQRFFLERLTGWYPAAGKPVPRWRTRRPTAVFHARETNKLSVTDPRIDFRKQRVVHSTAPPHRIILSVQTGAGRHPAGGSSV